MHYTFPTGRYESRYRKVGYQLIAGIDEVGRGAWAGPLVVGAVILPVRVKLPGLRDSKQLTPHARERLAEQIKAKAIAWSLGVVEVPELDSIGLARALKLAATRAVSGLEVRPEVILTDGQVRLTELDIIEHPIVRGDWLVRSIAAASIVAKVARDRSMRVLARSSNDFIHFLWDENNGYPSLHHRTMLAKFGPTVHHRKSFRPIAEFLREKGRQ